MINLNLINEEPVIRPYPNYNLHQNVVGSSESSAYKRMFNVIDIYLDRKGLLWILDNGDKDEGNVVVKNYVGSKVLAVDVHTNEVISKVRGNNIMKNIYRSTLNRFHAL